MKEIHGSQTWCKVFTDDIEETAAEQIRTFTEHPVFKDCPIRIMPDVHAGAGSVIGFTSPIGNGVIPYIIGVDIGCGVRAVHIPDFGKSSLATWDAYLRERIPCGFNNRETARNDLGELPGQIAPIAEKIGVDLGKVLRSIGSLGSGNHFIEIDRDDLGFFWLVVHTGSRNFGLRVAEYHQEKAAIACGTTDRTKSGKLKPTGTEWLEGNDAEEYLHDMRVAQRMAEMNRRVILDELLRPFPTRDEFVTIESVHNFIGDDDIIRKGAISAYEGQTVIIPGNMRDGLIIGRGKGNADWNYSAPHGAGRTMSRGQAKRELSLDTFRDEMNTAGVWSSCIGKETLDEAPGAYKPFADVLALIGDTVEVTRILKPIYNFKATE